MLISNKVEQVLINENPYSVYYINIYIYIYIYIYSALAGLCLTRLNCLRKDTLLRKHRYERSNEAVKRSFEEMHPKTRYIPLKIDEDILEKYKKSSNYKAENAPLPLYWDISQCWYSPPLILRFYTHQIPFFELPIQIQNKDKFRNKLRDPEFVNKMVMRVVLDKELMKEQNLTEIQEGRSANRDLLRKINDKFANAYEMLSLFLVCIINTKYGC